MGCWNHVRQLNPLHHKAAPSPYAQREVSGTHGGQGQCGWQGVGAQPWRYQNPREGRRPGAGACGCHLPTFVASVSLTDCDLSRDREQIGVCIPTPRVSVGIQGMFRAGQLSTSVSAQLLGSLRTTARGQTPRHWRDGRPTSPAQVSGWPGCAQRQNRAEIITWPWPLETRDSHFRMLLPAGPSAQTTFSSQGGVAKAPFPLGDLQANTAAEQSQGCVGARPGSCCPQANAQRPHCLGAGPQAAVPEALVPSA